MFPSLAFQIHMFQSRSSDSNRENTVMASANDMKAAQKTYDGFLTLLKFSVPVVIAITAIIVIAIGS